MLKRSTILIVSMVFSLALFLVGCQPASTTTGSNPGDGTLAGIVTDNPVTKQPGVASRNYAGISVIVHKAIEAGTYRTSADAPLKTSYKTGEVVAEAVSDKDGRFRFSLPTGFYMVRGAGGEKVYASGVLAEIKTGATTDIVLHLNFGV